MQASKWIVRVVAFCGALFAAMGSSVAQDKWPSKPIHIVVPFATGGSTDLLARRLAQALGERTGATVIVENRPGAAGTVGTEYVAQQPADGYTLMMGGTSTHAIAPLFYPKLRYDPIKDFTPLTIMVNFPYVLVANPSVPANTLKELVDLAKRQPVSVASNGHGTGNHLLALRFAGAAGVKMVQVPYKGSGPAISDLVGGHVNVMFNDVMTTYPNVKSGKIRPLAITSTTRSLLMPDVPTLAEAGYPEVKVDNWIGLLAPANMPPQLVGQISGELIAVLKTEKMREYIKEQGGEESAVSPAEFAEVIRNGGVMWRKVVQDAGIKPE